MNQSENTTENLFFLKNKSKKINKLQSNLTIIILTLCTAFTATILTIKHQETIKQQTIQINNIKIAEKNIHTFTKFTLNNEINEIKKINLIQWKLNFINKINPELLNNTSIENTTSLLNKTHKAYTEKYFSFNKIYYGSIFNNNNIEKFSSSADQLIIKEIAEFTNNTKTNNIYQTFIDEQIIDNLIKDKKEFEKYLTANKSNISIDENILIDKITKNTYIYNPNYLQHLQNNHQ